MSNEYGKFIFAKASMILETQNISAVNISSFTVSSVNAWVLLCIDSKERQSK